MVGRRACIYGMLAMAAVATVTCASEPAVPLTYITLGTWGGDNAGAIVTDSLAHVHIGCTYGDIQGRVAVHIGGNFSETGSYLLRAYPIAVGPTMPARFFGNVNRNTMTITVVVTDTIEHTTVTKGPVTLQLGKEPAMGPCPICRTPGERAKLMGAVK